MMINLGRYKFTLLEFVVSNNAHTFLSCILDFHVQLCFFCKQLHIASRCEIYDTTISVQARSLHIRAVFAIVP